MIARLITAACIALLLISTGCQRTRSFLHMNSDSPSPFLGLELSVDADPPRNDQANSHGNDHSYMTVSLPRKSSRRGFLQATQQTRVAEWFGGGNGSQHPEGEIIQLPLETPDADESAAIDALLARFGS